LCNHTIRYIIVYNKIKENISHRARTLNSLILREMPIGLPKLSGHSIRRKTPAKVSKNGFWAIIFAAAENSGYKYYKSIANN
jgi:hypothetical protein